MDRAGADNRSVLSITTDGADVGEGLPSIHPDRNESNEVKIPAKLPTVPNLADWSIPIAQALAQAFAYSDSADMAWLGECHGPTLDIEYVGDSGSERLG